MAEIPLLALTLAVLGRAAPPPDAARLAAEAEIAVPQLQLELPGPRYACFEMRLRSPRGLAARSALEALRAIRDRLRFMLEAGAPPSELEPLAAGFEAARRSALERGLVAERRAFFGTALRYTARLLEGDYALERVAACRP